MNNTLKDEFLAAVDSMTATDMPNEDLLDVAKSCSCAIAVSLIKNCSGMFIAVPKRSTAKVAKRFVIDKFDGSNAKQLSRACGVSLRHIYEIIEAEDARRKTKSQERTKPQ